MTRDEFNAKFRPELMGFLSEVWALRNADTRALGLLFDQTHLKARRLLDAVWNEFNPPPDPAAKPAANGQVTTNGNHVRR